MNKKGLRLLFGKNDNDCRLFFRLDLVQMVVDSPAGDGICADQDYLGNMSCTDNVFLED